LRRITPHIIIKLKRTEALSLQSFSLEVQDNSKMCDQVLPQEYMTWKESGRVSTDRWALMNVSITIITLLLGSSQPRDKEVQGKGL